MRLYHERQSDLRGGLDARDEEECFTAAGRRQVGVYLTTERVAGPNAFTAEVDPVAIEPYEVTAESSATRSFVVPGAIVATLGFRSQDE